MNGWKAEENVLLIKTDTEAFIIELSDPMYIIQPDGLAARGSIPSSGPYIAEFKTFNLQYCVPERRW